jgi:hypothetical protein
LGRENETVNGWMRSIFEQFALKIRANDQRLLVRETSLIALLARDSNSFNHSEDDVCMMFAPGDQRKSGDNQRERALNARICAAATSIYDTSALKDDTGAARRFRSSQRWYDAVQRKCGGRVWRSVRLSHH